MEDPRLVSAEEGKEGGSTSSPSSAPSPAPVTMKPSLSSESMVEDQALTMKPSLSSESMVEDQALTMKPSLSSESMVEDQALTMKPSLSSESMVEDQALTMKPSLSSESMVEDQALTMKPSLSSESMVENQAVTMKLSLSSESMVEDQALTMKPSLSSEGMVEHQAVTMKPSLSSESMVEHQAVTMKPSLSSESMVEHQAVTMKPSLSSESMVEHQAVTMKPSLSSESMVEHQAVTMKPSLSSESMVEHQAVTMKPSLSSESMVEHQAVTMKPSLSSESMVEHQAVTMKPSLSSESMVEHQAVTMEPSLSSESMVEHQAVTMKPSLSSESMVEHQAVTMKPSLSSESMVEHQAVTMKPSLSNESMVEHQAVTMKPSISSESMVEHQAVTMEPSLSSESMVENQAVTMKPSLSSESMVEHQAVTMKPSLSSESMVEHQAVTMKPSLSSESMVEHQAVTMKPSLSSESMVEHQAVTMKPSLSSESMVENQAVTMKPSIFNESMVEHQAVTMKPSISSESMVEHQAVTMEPSLSSESMVENQAVTMKPSLSSESMVEHQAVTMKPSLSSESMVEHQAVTMKPSLSSESMVEHQAVTMKPSLSSESMVEHQAVTMKPSLSSESMVEHQAVTMKPSLSSESMVEHQAVTMKPSLSNESMVENQAVTMKPSLSSESMVEHQAVTMKPSLSSESMVEHQAVTMKPSLCNESMVEHQAVTMKPSLSSESMVEHQAVTMKPSLSSESMVENQAVTMKPSLSSESMVENKAIAMANNDNSPALSSPTEASPAKPAITFPSITNGTIHTSPTTSDITSASDSLTSAEMSLVKAPMPSVPLLMSACPSDSLAPDMQVEKGLPPVLTFKGIRVTLENNGVWTQFHGYGTEMILTKQGRRMFPYCRYRLSGLEPTRSYSLVLSIAPADQHKYRWNMDKWEASGPAEHQCQGLIRAFSHHHSPCAGAAWMDSLVSFYKLKLTNNPQDQDGHMILHSMHRYIPRLHVIPVPDGVGPTPEHPVVKGPESLTFTFPQTAFFAVTSYQNLRITRLKINHNPFARGFRDDGHSPGPRLPRPKTEAERDDGHSPGPHLPRPKTEAEREATQLPSTPNTPNGSDSVQTRPNSSDGVVRKGVVGLCTKRSGSPSPSDETRARQKKVAADENGVRTDASARGKAMENGDGHHLHRQHLRAQLALPPRRLSLDTPFAPKPELSFPVVPVKPEVPSPPTVPFLSPKEEAKDKRQAVCVTPKVRKPFSMAPKPSPVTPTSFQSSPASSPGHRKRKRTNRHWGNSRGKDWKAGTVASTPTGSPPATATTQPELDDVEGLLFVSFTSKEALGVHVEVMPVRSSSPVFLAPPPPEKTAKGDQEKIARLETVLLQDLQLLKHRQVIHPVLQEVGLKLSSLDQTQAIDLQYLGVCLPLPPLANTASGKSSMAGGFVFVSRTGKTSDLTKIKGWRDKFIKNKESSSAQRAAAPKNLSAFCSNMLDEYLESEADKITQRAAAFSTNHDVAYQLPATSSSYVKTLDSVLKRRNLPAWSNRPCPLSYKPQQYLMNLLPRPATGPPQKTSRSKGQSVSPQTNAGPKHIAPKPWQAVHPVKKPTPKARAKGDPGTKGAHGASPASHGSTLADPGASQTSGKGLLLSRPSGLSKHQVRLVEMEEGALNQGLDRTHLTRERLAVALAVILTAKTLPRDRFKVPLFTGARGPECGREFCRLGCVCSSLHRAIRGPLHCRRPDCMLGCACFKRKITKQAVEPEKQVEYQSQTVYSVCNVEHEVQPSPGFHSRLMWDKTTAVLDPEPIFTPKPSQDNHGKLDHKRYVPRLNQPVREEDKDPIYKYFESMMTCARVREFTRTKVEPQSHVLPHPHPSTKELLQKFQTVLPKKTPNTILRVDKKGKAPPQDQSEAQEPSKQVEIQSECEWDKDRKMVLTGLCRRMNENRLTPPFHVGPYFIRLVSKLYTRTQSGSTITYKVRLSKPNEPSHSKEGKSEDSDDEVTDCSSVEEEEAMEEEKPQEELEMQVGVTPFLGGILPAGRLRANTKASGRPAEGLVQVNGKSYAQARLLLGSMGSLHPANRLAAYITGRLRGTGRTSPPKDIQKHSQKADSLPHIQGTVSPPGTAGHKTMVTMGPKEPPASPTTEDLPSSPTLLIPFTPTASDSSAGSPPPALPPGGKTLILQPIATAQGARLYRLPNGHLVKLVPKKQTTPIKARVVSVGKSPGEGQPFRTNILRKGPNSTTPHHSPLVTYITGPRGSITTTQNSSSTSPSSASLPLNLSPTLKPPSFLGKSGTCSFRIYPPAADQASRGSDQSPPGKALPGGFTLLQLPKPWLAGARATMQPPVNCTNSNMTAVPAHQKQMSTSNHSETNGDTDEPDLVPDCTHTGTKDQSKGRRSGPGSFPDLLCDEKIQSDSDNTEKMQSDDSDNTEKSDPDTASEDDLSDSSDSDEQEDINEDSVDIETVEDSKQRNTIDKMRADARRLVLEAQDSSEDSGSAREHRVKGLSDEDGDESAGGGRRRNHKVTERLRRSEQRHLFNRLQDVLHIHDDPRAPKLKLLSLALAEIQNLVVTSRCLEKKKRRLKEMQSLYVKEISRLAGRPEALVQTKLRQICERRKAMAAVGSGHLPPIMKPQHQTPKPQVTAQQVKPRPPTLPLPQPPTQPQPQPELATAPALAQVTAPPPWLPGPPPSPLVALLPKPDPPPQVPVISPSPMALIRSKTGRIILPSSMRPAGPGYYTLMVMGSDKERKAGEGEEEEEEEEDEEEEEEECSGPQTQPSDLGSSKAGERTPSERELLPEEGENPADGHGTAEEENTSSALNNTAQVSKTSPLFQMARLNRAIWKPPHLKPLQTACLSFNPGTRPVLLRPKPPKAEGVCSEPVDSPEMVDNGFTPVKIRRPVGRPRKHPVVLNLESKSVETAFEDGKRTPSDREKLTAEGEDPDSHGTTKEEETSSALNNTGRVSKKSPLVEIPRLGGATWKPRAGLRTVEGSMSRGKVLVLGRTKAAACLSVPKPKEDEEEDIKVVSRRPVGRPRKHPLPQNGESESVDKAKRTKAKQTPAAESPEPVKPRRGRPPNKPLRGVGRPRKKPRDSVIPDGTGPAAKSVGSTRASSSPVTRAGGSPAKARQAQCSPAGPAPSPVTQTNDSPTAQLGEVSGTRPVTRGALGKDFPSAKKRSWKDIENEIDSDEIDSEEIDSEEIDSDSDSD